MVAPPEYDYQSFCWTSISSGCKLDDGGVASDVRVLCDSGNPYACVVKALEKEGKEGWLLLLEEDSFPAASVLYLMARESR